MYALYRKERENWKFSFLYWFPKQDFDFDHFTSCLTERPRNLPQMKDEPPRREELVDIIGFAHEMNRFVEFTVTVLKS